MGSLLLLVAGALVVRMHVGYVQVDKLAELILAKHHKA